MTVSALRWLSHLLVFVIMDLPFKLFLASLAKTSKGHLFVDLLRKGIELDLIGRSVLVLLALLLSTVVHQQTKL